MEYWWLALIIVLAGVLAVFLTWLLRDKRKISIIILFVIGLVLLVYKTIEFSVYRIIGKSMYPVEFSQMSYFVLGFTFVLGIKKMRAYAGFCSALAGVAYIVAGIAAPDSIVSDTSSVFYIVMAVIQHSVLFFCGLLLLCNVDKYKIKEIYVPIIGVAIMVLVSVLIHNGVIYKNFDGTDNMIIIKIITGEIITYVIPSASAAVKVISAIVIAFVIVGILCLYYVVNSKLFKSREEKGKMLADADFDIGIIPWIRSYVSKKEALKLEQSAKDNSENKIEEDDTKKLD